jgi:hypothetical protein
MKSLDMNVVISRKKNCFCQLCARNSTKMTGNGNKQKNLRTDWAQRRTYKYIMTLDIIVRSPVSPPPPPASPRVVSEVKPPPTRHKTTYDTVIAFGCGVLILGIQNQVHFCLKVTSFKVFFSN